MRFAEGPGEGQVLALVARALSVLAVQVLGSGGCPEELEAEEDLSVFDKEWDVVGPDLEDRRGPVALWAPIRVLPPPEAVVEEPRVVVS